MFSVLGSQILVRAVLIGCAFWKEEPPVPCSRVLPLFVENSNQNGPCFLISIPACVILKQADVS